MKHSKESLYNHEGYSKKMSKKISDTNLSVIEGYIKETENFNAINTLINHGNPRKDKSWEPENNSQGLKTIFVIGEVTNLYHQKCLEDIAFKIANGLGTVKERSKKILVAIQIEILRLKNED